MHKKHIGDVLFYSQILLAAIFSVGQLIHMIYVSTEGVLISFFGAWIIFSVFNLFLAFAAHKAQPSKVTLQTIIIYTWWAILIMVNLVTLLYQTGIRWTVLDTINILLIGIATSILLYIQGSLQDPIVKGCFTSFFKGIPHLTIGISIILYGGSGISWIMILIGHITISIRLAQLWFSVREAGWDKNRKGSLLSEGVSEGTWIITTIIWLRALS